MSWGKTVSGEPDAVIAEFKKFSDLYENGTYQMLEAEKEILITICTDIVPMLCDGITAGVTVEAGGSEGTWDSSVGLSREVSFKFRTLPGWVAKETAS